MNDRRQQVKTASAAKTGLFATLSNLLRARGSGAPSARLLALTPLLAIAGLALTAAPALANAPTATIDPAPTAAYTTAHVSGHVNPEDNDTYYYFQYSLQGTDHGAEGNENWSAANFQGPIPAGSGETAVSDELTNLTPGSEYEVRLAAPNFIDPEAFSAPPDPTFETEAVARPTVSIDPVTTFTATTAHLVGHVDPNAPEASPASPLVEAAFESSWHFECTPACPGLFGTVAADEVAHTVEAEATGLIPATAYTVKLIASNAGGTEEAPAASPSFTTPALPPAVDATSVSGVTTEEAELHARINPGGAPTTVRFQYITLAQFEANEESEVDPFTGAEETPESSSIGADNSDHEAAAAIVGLAPHTAYAYRVLASNEKSPLGGTPGPIAHLYTYASAAAPPESCPENEAIRARQAQSGLTALPDCRAYEQASPPGLQKNGVDAVGAAGDVYASPAGTAISYFSLIPFSTAAGSGASKFPIYQSSRAGAPPLWSTRGLMPLADITQPALVGLAEDSARSIIVVSALQPPSTPCEPTARVCANPGHASLYVEDNSTGAFQFIADLGLSPYSPVFAAASSDDSRLLFQTEAQLLPEAAPGVVNLYLWDEAEPFAQRLSLVDLVPSSGASCAGAACAAPAAGSGPVSDPYHMFYLQHTISADGSRAFFTDEASHDLYERLLDSGETIRVSGGASPAAFREATPDGRYVFYTEGEDLYRFDTETEATLALTSGSAGVLGDLGVSADASTAYFAATAALTGAEENESGASAQPGQPNIYRWHQGATTFIAGSGNGADWRNAADFANEAAGPAGGQRSSRLTADGSVLLFAANNRVTSYDNAGLTEFYRYDSRRPPGQRLRCVSCNPSGASPTVSVLGQARLTSSNPALVASPGSLPFLTRNLSADGSRAFFQTAESLLPADTNGALDVYEWEAPGAAAGSCAESSPAYSPQDGGCLYLISTGQSSDQSYFGDASADGSDVFFFTRQRLVSQDSDVNSDLYDARSGGGIDAQSPPPHSPPCAGEASCLPPASTPPAEPGAVTESFHGPGNEPEPTKCRKGFVRKHGTCVKRSHKKRHTHTRHHSKRSTRANRRAAR